MYILSNFLFVLFYISATNAAASIGFYHNPAYPGKCYVNETMIMNAGDVLYFKPCTRWSCDSEQGHVSVFSCGVVGVPPKCSVYYPKSDENYPACCKVAIRCDEENELLQEDEIKHKYAKVPQNVCNKIADTTEETTATEEIPDTTEETAATEEIPNSTESETAETTTIAQ